MANEGYLLAQNWNNTAGFDVLPTTYSPRTPRTDPGRRQFAGDMLEYIDGYWDSALIFDALPDAEFTAFLTFAGLSYTTQSAKVTIYLPHRDQAWRAWNAIIRYPEDEHRPERWEPATFPLKLVQEVAYTP